MSKLYLSCFLVLWFTIPSISQNVTKKDSSSGSLKLFSRTEVLDLKLSYSIKELKKNKKDSLYINTLLFYRNGNNWDSINVRLIARGNFRFTNCYFPPLKLKIKKANSKGTLFEGHKTLRIVIPCLEERDKNDNVIKEYLAYMLYESVTDYHFKTRLLNIKFDEIKGNKVKRHVLKGILIEDDKIVAKRFNGKVFDRFSHPLNHNALASARNSFFQFMIGNTDFSMAYQHNVKMIFIDKKMIPIAYDFDMCGFVNSSYAVVSDVSKKSLNITSVTERKYRGFKRDQFVFNQVRKEYQEKEAEILSVMNNSEYLFENTKEFNTAKIYIQSFFKILNNDKLFKNYILDQARSN
jgi:hypothetical protein